MNETAEYNFIISGNQENPDGNPIPYHRTTRGSYWNEGSKRYAAWKEYVVAASGLEYQFNRKKMKMENPIVIPLGYKATMGLKMFFANESHADPDNIYKGIADALFFNDKKLSGSTDFDMANDKKGRVYVRINVFPMGIT